MKILFSIVLLIVGYSLSAQTADSNNVYFKGGSKKLENSIYHYLSGKHNGLLEDRPATDRKFNRYVLVLFSLDKFAHLEDMNVFSVGDSALTCDTVLTGLIAGAVRQTEGNWVNSTGQQQTILLPVFYMYYEDAINKTQPLPVLPMTLTRFRNGRKEPVLSFHPVIVTLYPYLH